MASAEVQRLLRFGWSSARYALGPIGGLLVPWIVMHRTGAASWGDAMRIIIPIQIFLHVAAWGSKDFLLRQFAVSPGDPRSWAAQSLFTRALLMLPIAGLVAFLGPLEWKMAALWFFTSFAASAMEPVLIWRKRFSALLLIDALGLITQVVVLWIMDPTTDGVILSFLLGSVVRLAVVASIVRRWPPLDAPIYTLDISFNDHLLKAFPFFLIGFSGLLATRIDLYTMNLLVDRAQMGVYQVVTAVFTQFQVLPGLIVLPMTRELYRLDRSSVQRGAKRLFRLGLLLTLPMLGAAWCLFTLVFHFDLHWSVYLAGALATLPAYGYSPCITHLFKRHRERYVVIACFASAATTLLLTVVLAPRLGYAGALIASAAGQWLLFVMVLHTLERDAQP